MKKLLFALPIALLFLASCGGSDHNALEDVLETIDDFDAATNSFAEGKAETGRQYFEGLLSGVIEIDVAMREVEELDDMDAPAEEIKMILDSALINMKESRKALNLYKNKDWPRRADFHDLTNEWYDAVEGMIKDYLLPLADAMSKPDDTWSQDEMDLYADYADAYDEYIEIDNRWVEFQETFAIANGFTLSDETIDVDALVEQDMAEK